LFIVYENVLIEPLFFLTFDTIKMGDQTVLLIELNKGEFLDSKIVRVEQSK
jgi:hypothetical protein